MGGRLERHCRSILRRICSVCSRMLPMVITKVISLLSRFTECPVVDLRFFSPLISRALPKFPVYDSP
jgi:hypothetical protein